VELEKSTSQLAESPLEFPAILANQLARNRYLDKLRDVSFPELTGIVEHVMESFHRWDAGDIGELASCCNFISNACLALSIPLVEVAYALYVLRDGLVASLSSSGEHESGCSSRQASKFFDQLVLRLLCHY